jgi:hypothetical protein
VALYWETTVGIVLKGLLLVALLAAVSALFSSGCWQCTRLRQGATATGMEGLVPLPTAMTHINPGHVGLVIHRVSGRMDPTPLGSTHGTGSPPGSRNTHAHADAGAHPSFRTGITAILD